MFSKIVVAITLLTQRIKAIRNCIFFLHTENSWLKYSSVLFAMTLGRSLTRISKTVSFFTVLSLLLSSSVTSCFLKVDETGSNFFVDLWLVVSCSDAFLESPLFSMKSGRSELPMTENQLCTLHLSCKVVYICCFLPLCVHNIK